MARSIFVPIMDRFTRSRLLASLAVLVAHASAVPVDADTFTYVGSARCRMCHSSERIGAQYHVWAESRHAKAFATLGTSKARAMAKKRGIADPQKSPQCLPCHVTGYGEAPERFSSTYSMADGVSCEGCHGPGSGYSKIPIMQGIREGRLKAEDYGLSLSDKTTCARCHNDKPESGGFISWPRDSARIAHPIPAGYRIGDQAP